MRGDGGQTAGIWRDSATTSIPRATKRRSSRTDGFLRLVARCISSENASSLAWVSAANFSRVVADMTHFKLHMAQGATKAPKQVGRSS
jgi:hypothetical protein